MNSIQESTNELNAAIRYAENAITSAKQTIESMQFRQDMAKKQYTEQTGREQALLKELEAMTDKYDRMKGYADGLLDENGTMEAELEKLRKEKEASSGPCGCQAYRDLEEKVATMPVIPKDVAIAIFREGIKQGVYDACYEIDNSDSVEVSDYILEGGFEVHFTKYVDLTEHINTDWMRGKVGNYEESNAIATLKGLCEDKKFECRIHGVDDNTTK